ncbi:hypothetical protein OQA88_2642 [Cercophora sp. LCS_1]
MADVRVLLRQQRAARRIEHPQAAYSDAGKLLCLACHEHIKTESLWDSHIRSASHRQRLQAQARAQTSASTNGAASHKRKLDEDEEMSDGNNSPDEESIRKKRSKPDMSKDQPTSADKDEAKVKPLTPPLTRRQSGTPTIGVEMQIPSRPATPVALRDQASATGLSTNATTPKAAPLGRSPLIPQEPVVAQLPAKSTTKAAAPVDDDVWAAFEADLVHGSTGESSSSKAPAVAGFTSDAVISAPAMTAAEVAAKSEEEEQAKRKALVDIQIEDEKEEATRALETEFEVMEELEARARKLRERREAIRRNSTSVAAGVGGSKPEKPVALGKENAVVEDDEEDDEDETEDDWVGFRFRA